MFFGICLDIMLLCTMALILYLFMKRGFVRVTLSGLSVLISIGVSFVLTRLLAKPIARGLAPVTQRFIVRQSTRILPDEKALDTLASVSDKVIAVFRAVVRKMNPEAVASTVEAAERDSLYEVSYGITYTFYGFLLFALLFAVSFSVMRILSNRISFFERFPVLRVVDSSASLIAGIIVCIIVLFVPAIIMFSILPSVFGSGITVPKSVFSGSLLLRLTYILYPFR